MKVHPPDKTIVSNVYLSFLPGAKIGVLGVNGTGKSSLLRIMAGVDKEYTGEAWARARRHHRLPGAGARPGQRRDRHGGGRRGRGRDAQAAGALRRGQHEARRVAVRRRDEQGARGAGQAPGSDRRRRRLESGPPARAGHGRAAPAARRRADQEPVGRREAPRGALSDPATKARPAAARRAHQPSRCRVGAVARAAPGAVPGLRGGGHPRSLLPRQRGRVDPRARSRQAPIPFKGNYSSWLEQKQRAPGAGREGRERPAAQAGARARVGAAVAQGAPGQEQGAPAGLRQAAQRVGLRQARSERDLHPARAAPGRPGVRGGEHQQELRRQAAVREPQLQGAQERRGGHHRPERRRQDHAVQAADRRRARPTRARCASARPSSSRTSTRAATR